jgi:ElaB/YqjD/DUF883 family membrane-anchored ribosome-binding protein
LNPENNKSQPPEQPMVGETGSASATARSMPERVAEVYEQAEQAVGDAYEKTAQTVSEAYEQAKSYTSKNPGRTILITLGIGVGLGFFLGASSRRSRGSRFAQPVVNALSDIALEFFR